ncbi:MAG: hypothetical protein RSC06_15545, partial [Clostridia bacterium]
ENYTRSIVPDMNRCPSWVRKDILAFHVWFQITDMIQQDPEIRNANGTKTDEATFKCSVWGGRRFFTSAPAPLIFL